MSQALPYLTIPAELGAAEGTSEGCPTPARSLTTHKVLTEFGFGYTKLNIRFPPFRVHALAPFRSCSPTFRRLPLASPSLATLGPSSTRDTKILLYALHMNLDALPRDATCGVGEGSSVAALSLSSSHLS